MTKRIDIAKHIGSVSYRTLMWTAVGGVAAMVAAFAALVPIVQQYAVLPQAVKTLGIEQNEESQDGKERATQISTLLTQSAVTLSMIHDIKDDVGEIKTRLDGADGVRYPVSAGNATPLPTELFTPAMANPTSSEFAPVPPAAANVSVAARSN